MKLLPIKEHLHENEDFATNPDCQDSLYMCIDFYKRAGFNPPWICYYVQIDNQLVAAAAFKGKPVNNKVEIAYGTFPQNRPLCQNNCTNIERGKLFSKNTSKK